MVADETGEFPSPTKVAFVTGGGKRIGARICHFLAENGFAIIVHAHRSIVESQELSSSINEFGGRAITVSADLGNSQEISRLIDQVLTCDLLNEFDGLSLLVNSASRFIDTTGLSAEDKSVAVRNMNALHVEAPQQLSEGLFDSLVQGKGSIINIVDALLHRQSIGYRDYSISKQKLVSQTKVLAANFAPSVRVNGIGPGAILPSPSEQDKIESIAKSIPLGRWGDPLDIASTVLFLATNEYITGQIINVDGGLSLSQN